VKLKRQPLKTSKHPLLDRRRKAMQREKAAGGNNTSKEKRGRKGLETLAGKKSGHWEKRRAYRHDSISKKGIKTLLPKGR